MTIWYGLNLVIFFCIFKFKQPTIMLALPGQIAQEEVEQKALAFAVRTRDANYGNLKRKFFFFF